MGHATRRVFLLQLAAAGPALAAETAAAPAKALDEKDPTAVSLGYVADAARVDAKRFPKRAKNQVCGNCQLYMGTAADPWASCPIFVGRKVSAQGWCATWAKKA